MNFLRLLIGSLATFGGGIVIYEVVRHAGFAGVESLPVLWWGLGAAAVFLGDQGLQYLLDRHTGDTANRAATIYYRFLGLICLVLLAALPLLWWGVMKELARVPGR